MKSSDRKQPDMRQRIKTLASRLLIKHGYRGVSFGDIAEALSTTRANIHYHFGNKNSLVDEVTEAYVAGTLARYDVIWTNPDTTLDSKLEASIAFNRQRYDEFNQGNEQGLSWSLVARMRADSDALGPRSVAAVQRFAADLTNAIRVGVSHAVQQGELSPDTPVEDVVALLVNVINSAGLVTQDAARFDQLDLIYRAMSRIIEAAYGRHARPEAPEASPASAPNHASD